MANSEHLAILKQGIEVWNKWREANPQIKPDLRGAKLRDKLLEGANFSNADLRSTDFTNAKLQGANFTGAKAGLQKHWEITVLIFSCLLSALSGVVSDYLFPILILTFNSTLIKDPITTGISLTISLIVFFTVTLYKSLRAGVIITSIILAFAYFGVFFQGFVLGTSNNIFATVIVAVIWIFVLSFTIAVTIAIVVAENSGVVIPFIGVLIGSIAYAGFLVITQPTVGVRLTIASVGVYSIPVGLVFTLPGTYIGWRSLSGNKKDIWIRSTAIACAAINGTSFQDADLTDADFTESTLKNTDFRNANNANLTRTRWKNAQKLNLARPGDTYLKRLEVQQWLIGQGKDKNFDRQNLRGINFQGYNLTEASFIGADLSEANLQDADLSRAKLVQSQVDKTNFTGATLTGAFIEDWGITAETILNGVICDHVFMRLPPDKRPNWLKLPPEESLDPNARRKPDDWQKDFEEGEFEDFIAPLIQTLDLYHNQAVDPRLVAISFKDLQQAHPKAKLELISMEKKGKNRDKLHLKVATSPQADLSALHADYFANLDYLKALPPEAQQALLIERSETLRMLLAGGSNTTINNFQNQENQQNQENTNMTDNRNIKIDQGNYNENIEGDYMKGNKYSITGDNNQGVQGDNNQGVQQNRVDTNTGEEITQAKVIELLAELSQKISSSELPEETKQKTLNRLGTVADDVKEPEPDKKLVAGNLKKVTETLTEASKSTEEAKKLWNNVQPILEIVGKWLEVGIKFFGM